MIGQFYGHVTLTMWRLSSFWRNAIRWRDCSCFACLFILIFMMFWHQSTLCKVITQAANSVNSNFPAFSSVKLLHCGEFYTIKGQKSLSRKSRKEGAKVRSVTKSCCQKLSVSYNLWKNAWLQLLHWKKSLSIKEWIPEASAVKTMNDQSFLFSSNKIAHYLNNGRLQAVFWKRYITFTKI